MNRFSFSVVCRFSPSRGYAVTVSMCGPLRLPRHPGKLTKLRCRQCSYSLGERGQLALVLFYGLIKVFYHTSLLS
jgi:hypothetical protein